MYCYMFVLKHFKVYKIVCLLVGVHASSSALTVCHHVRPGCSVWHCCAQGGQGQPCASKQAACAAPGVVGL